MIRRSMLLACAALMVIALQGCIKMKSHLTINKDGTGTYEYDQYLPKGSVMMVDYMIKEMEKAFGPQESGKKQPSWQEQFTGSSEDILKKAKKAGVNIGAMEHSTNNRDGGLGVHCKFTFDNLGYFLDSGIYGSNEDIRIDDKGQLVCEFEEKEDKKKESKEQRAQFDQWKGSDSFKQLGQEVQEAILNSFKEFEMESKITFPNDVTSVSGLFKKDDNRTVSIRLTGDLLNDPDLVRKAVSAAISPTKAVCGGEGISFTIQRRSKKEAGDFMGTNTSTVYFSNEENSSVATDRAGTEKKIEDIPIGATIRVHLKAGGTYEGKLIEKKDGIFKMAYYNIPVTFIPFEVTKVEELSS